MGVFLTAEIIISIPFFTRTVCFVNDEFDFISYSTNIFVSFQIYENDQDR